MNPRHRHQRAKRDPRAMLDPGPTYSRRTWPRYRREQQNAGIVPASTLFECRALGMDPHDLRRDFCHAARVCDFDRARTHPDGWHFVDPTLAVALCWYVTGRLHQARPAHERPAAEAAAGDGDGDGDKRMVRLGDVIAWLREREAAIDRGCPGGDERAWSLNRAAWTLENEPPEWAQPRA